MILKRIFAYCIDYFVIIIYAALLFLLTYTIHKILDQPLTQLDPITGNVISFFTLTLPVFLYFFFYESSSKKGTIGKQWVKIKVENNSKRNIFIRVFFKIFPWEMAHFGIHWALFYSNQGVEIPLWNWIVNIVPQIIVIIYFITIVLSKGKSSIYDRIANTRIESFQ
ncbi:RDD family protein [Lacinutrix neustonica]|uniref:RDD family protein n=1 Tax=Lacinutrix neustonica TaxID=2980107 RepID=A0A9E8MW98_9FLAO|nr:RDD family protein [Lacinutrix neustonica]WAC02758.1 RDD family protein [Lacinutrix neustonica]